MEWVPILLVLGVLGFYAVNRFFGGGSSGTTKRNFANEAKADAEVITDDADKSLDAHNAVIEKEREAIEKAKAIEDEEARLKALAELGDK